MKRRRDRADELFNSLICYVTTRSVKAQSVGVGGGPLPQSVCSGAPSPPWSRKVGMGIQGRRDEGADQPGGGESVFTWESKDRD